MLTLQATSIANLRDLGGSQLAGGRVVRSGLVFRSGQLDRFAPEMDEVAAGLRLGTIVDLRTEAERGARPDRVPAGARYVVADVVADLMAGEPAGSDPGADGPFTVTLDELLADPVAAERQLEGGRVVRRFESTYRALVSSDSARDAYRILLTELARPEAGPLLFHCAAGKDRTGWAATLLLGLLGADEAAITREYLSIGPALRQTYQPVIDRYLAGGGRLESILALTGVRTEYLAAALDEVARRHGSMAGYVRDGLGVPDTTVATLVERLTEPAHRRGTSSTLLYP